MIKCIMLSFILSFWAISLGEENSLQLSSTFNQKVEFPLLFLSPEHRNTSADKIPANEMKQSKKLLEKALQSIFKRLQVPLIDPKSGEFMTPFYFDFLKAQIPKGVKVMPSGGIVRSAISYVYAQLLEEYEKGGEFSHKKILQDIIDDKKAIAGGKIRGIGSDFDVLVRGASEEELAKAKIIIEQITNSAEKKFNATEIKTTTKRALFTVGDVKSYDGQITRSSNQGGSTIDLLAFDIDEGVVIEPKNHSYIFDDLIQGFYRYIAPAEGKYEDFSKQVVRGIRPLLEIPFIRMKDEAQFREELQKLSSEKSMTEKAWDQINKIVRNARFSGANNRIVRGEKGSVESLILEFNKELTENKIPEFVDRSPLHIRENKKKVLNGLNPESLITAKEFIAKYTAKGVLFHGTPRIDNGFAILRGGMFISGGTYRAGNFTVGTGGYSSKGLGTSQSYAGKDGIVLELKMKNDPRINILDLTTTKGRSEYERLKKESSKLNMDHHLYLSRNHGIDIIQTSGHTLILNTNVYGLDSDVKVILDSLGPKLKDKSATPESFVRAYNEYKKYRPFGQAIGHEKLPLIPDKRKEFKRFKRQLLADPQSLTEEFAKWIPWDRKKDADILKKTKIRFLEDSQLMTSEIHRWLPWDRNKDANFFKKIKIKFLASPQLLRRGTIEWVPWEVKRDADFILKISKEGEAFGNMRDLKRAVLENDPAGFSRLFPNEEINIIEFRPNDKNFSMSRGSDRPAIRLFKDLYRKLLENKNLEKWEWSYFVRSIRESLENIVVLTPEFEQELIEQINRSPKQMNYYLSFDDCQNNYQMVMYKDKCKRLLERMLSHDPSLREKIKKKYPERYPYDLKNKVERSELINIAKKSLSFDQEQMKTIESYLKHRYPKEDVLNIGSIPLSRIRTSDRKFLLRFNELERMSNQRELLERAAKNLNIDLKSLEDGKIVSRGEESSISKVDISIKYDQWRKKGITKYSDLSSLDKKKFRDFLDTPISAHHLEIYHLGDDFKLWIKKRIEKIRPGDNLIGIIDSSYVVELMEPLFPDKVIEERLLREVMITKKVPGRNFDISLLGHDAEDFLEVIKSFEGDIPDNLLQLKEDFVKKIERSTPGLLGKLNFFYIPDDLILDPKLKAEYNDLKKKSETSQSFKELLHRIATIDPIGLMKIYPDYYFFPKIDFQLIEGRPLEKKRGESKGEFLFRGLYEKILGNHPVSDKEWIFFISSMANKSDLRIFVPPHGEKIFSIMKTLPNTLEFYEKFESCQRAMKKNIARFCRQMVGYFYSDSSYKVEIKKKYPGRFPWNLSSGDDLDELIELSKKYREVDMNILASQKKMYFEKYGLRADFEMSDDFNLAVIDAEDQKKFTEFWEMDKQARVNDKIESILDSLGVSREELIRKKALVLESAKVSKCFSKGFSDLLEEASVAK